MRTRILLAALVIGWAHAASAEVTLLFWPGPESEAMQKVIDAYNAGPGKGAEVKQLLFSRQGYFDKEIADLAAGSKEFDLALVTTYTLGRYAPFLEPVGGSLPSDTKQRFAPVALDSLAFQGQQLGVPTDISLHFTYYRTDLIDRLLKDKGWQAKYAELAQKHLGKELQPKTPDQWTWDDWMATAIFFTKSLNPESPTRYGTVLQLKNLIFNIMIWDATLVSNGGNWLDAQGKPAIDSEAAREGLQIYKKLIDLKATPADSTNYEYAEANAAFGSGQAATMLQWNAAFNELNDTAKNPTVAGKVWLAPMPAGSAGHKTHIHALGIGLNKASDPQGRRRQVPGLPRLGRRHARLRPGRRHPARPRRAQRAEGQAPRVPAGGRLRRQVRLRHRRRHHRPGGPDLRGPGPELLRLLGRPAHAR